MRVAYVCADPGVPVFGGKGCSVHVQEVLRALLERGAQIDLITYRLGGECPSDLNGVRINVVKIEPHTDIFRRERDLLSANSAVQRLLMELGPFDVIYERHSLWSHAAMDVARQSQIPGILEINAPLLDEQATHRTLLDARTARLVSAKAVTTASLVVAVSQKVADYACRLGASIDNVQIVANGVRPERFAADGKTKPCGEFRIGFVGSLRPWHGVSDLIDAFSRLPEISGLATPGLTIVGDGPQRAALEQQAASLVPAIGRRIQFLGSIPYEEVPSVLASFDVSVAPYIREQDCYFSPLKLFEYMAAGLPIVAARTGQLVQILEHQTNGLLYSPGDVEMLAEQLTGLRLDSELRQRLGRAARIDAARLHTWSHRVDSILQRARPLVHNELNSVV